MLGAPFCMFIKAWEFSLFFLGTPKHAFRSSSRHRLFFGFWTEVFCTMPFLPLPIPEPFDAPRMRIYQRKEQCQEWELSTNNTLMEYPWLSRIMKHCSWMFWVLPIFGNDDEQLLQYTEYMIIFPFLMAAHLLGRWIILIEKDLPKVWAAKKGAGWCFKEGVDYRVCEVYVLSLGDLKHQPVLGGLKLYKWWLSLSTLFW